MVAAKPVADCVCDMGGLRDSNALTISKLLDLSKLIS